MLNRCEVAHHHLVVCVCLLEHRVSKPTYGNLHEISCEMFLGSLLAIAATNLLGCDIIESWPKHDRRHLRRHSSSSLSHKVDKTATEDDHNQSGNLLPETTFATASITEEPPIKEEQHQPHPDLLNQREASSNPSPYFQHASQTHYHVAGGSPPPTQRHLNLYDPMPERLSLHELRTPGSFAEDSPFKNASQQPTNELHIPPTLPAYMPNRPSYYETDLMGSSRYLKNSWFAA